MKFFLFKSEEKNLLSPKFPPLSSCASKLALFSFLLCSACSPTQGYPGPRLPEDQVSQLFVEEMPGEQDSLVRITLDGIAFDSEGVEVLPGSHDIDAYQERLGRRRNCRPEQRFDRSSYEACLWRERTQRSRRRGSLWFPCSVSNYTTTIYHCLVQVTNSDCHLGVETKAGKKYSIRLKPQAAPNAPTDMDQPSIPASEPESGVFEKPSNEKVGSGECQQVLTHEEEREFSSP